MTPILKDRVLLIKAIQNAAALVGNSEFKDLISSIRKDELNHFLSLSQENYQNISYAKAPELKLNSGKRVRTTLGRYLKRNYKLGIPDKELDRFVSTVISIINRDRVLIKIIKGNEIITTYKEFDNNCPSCMTGGHSYKTTLYAENPDKVSLLCYNKIRALLWTCDDGTRVLDRAYPSGHYQIETLRQWATKKNYVLRRIPDKLVYSDPVELTDGKSHKITLSIPSNHKYPYLDTFCFGSFIDDKLVLSNSGNNHSLRFDYTNGEYRDYEYTNCQFCDLRINPDECSYFDDEPVCDSCYEENIFCCYICCSNALRENMFKSGAYGHLCRRCFLLKEKEFAICKVCDEVFLNHELHDKMCKKCQQRKV